MLRPADFKRVFEHPIRSHDHYFRILSRPNGVSCHRLGMAVAKKACSRAVGRNRIKRLVRESFRRQVVGNTIGESLDFVVLATAQTADKSNRVLDEALSKHWQTLIMKSASRKSGKNTR